MEVILSKLVDQLNSSVVVLLAILIIVAVGLYRFGYYLGQWKERFSAHDRRLAKVDVIHETVIKLDTKVQLIYDNTNPRATFRTASPIALTDLGKEIASSIKAETLFQRYLPALVGKINAKCPAISNAYDIQVAAMAISKKDLPDMATAEEVNLVKTEAFNRGMPAEDIWAIFGVYLRDHILKERDIAVAEVDKHNPGEK